MLTYTRTLRAYLPGACTYAVIELSIDTGRTACPFSKSARTASMQPAAAAAARQRSRRVAPLIAARHRTVGCYLLVDRPLAIGGLLALATYAKLSTPRSKGRRARDRAVKRWIDRSGGWPPQTNIPPSSCPCWLLHAAGGYAGHLKSREKKRPRAQGQASSQPASQRVGWPGAGGRSIPVRLSLPPQSSTSIYPGSQPGDSDASLRTHTWWFPRVFIYGLVSVLDWTGVSALGGEQSRAEQS